MRELLATLTLVVFVVVLSVVLMSSSSSDDYDDDDETMISAGRLQYYSQRGGRNAPDRLTVALYAEEEEEVTNEPSRSAASIPPVHMRWNPEWTFNHNAHGNENDGCHAGALCVGPGQLYPIGRQVLGVPTVTGSFVVPPLPLSFDPINTTYYDYLNIFWRTNPLPGFMNQFVPQLMLGNALANSTNHPHYKPQWIPLHQWHIGAQYFMAICPPVSSSTDNDNDTYRDDKDRDDKDVFNTMTNQSTTTQDDHAGSHYHHRQYDCDHWIAKAATGKLIAVEPGEGIFTSFELVTKTSHTKKDSDANSENNNNNNNHHYYDNENDNDGDDFEWHLTMGVIGADDSRISHLVVPKPFMGLLDAYNKNNNNNNNKSTPSSWMDEVYEQVYVGSCLENYGMYRRENYPSYWDLDVEIVQEPPRTNSTSSERENGTATSSSSSSWIWQDWKLEHDKTCDWQPDSQVSSRSGNGYQTASWRAWLHPPQPQPRPKRPKEGSYFGEEPDSTAME